jgi:extradiol dioxygenase family protein
MMFLTMTLVHSQARNWISNDLSQTMTKYDQKLGAISQRAQRDTAIFFFTTNQFSLHQLPTAWGARTAPHTSEFFLSSSAHEDATLAFATI